MSNPTNKSVIDKTWDSSQGGIANIVDATKSSTHKTRSVDPPSVNGKTKGGSSSVYSMSNKAFTGTVGSIEEKAAIANDAIDSEQRNIDTVPFTAAGKDAKA